MDVLDVLHALIESDREFVRNIRFFSRDRERLMSAQQRNFAIATNLLRVYMSSNSTTSYVVNLPLNTPNNWDEPVPVIPSAEQITDALELHIMMGENAICAICQDPVLSAARITQCRHHFHEHCIREWFTRSCYCPMCRSDIREPNISAAAHTQPPANNQ